MHPTPDAITDIVRDHWNGRAATFDREIGHGLHSDEQRQAWLALLARVAGEYPLRVLDIGCGTGVLSLLFAALGHQVTGIDLASDMIEVARRKAHDENQRIVFRVENAAALKDSDATYDIAIARHVIWTMPDPAKALAEWLRVLRPGGRLILIEGRWRPDPAETAPHRRRPFDAVAALLAAFSPRKRRAALRYFFGNGRMRRYRKVTAGLPFSGGPSAEQLIGFLEKQGLRELRVEPLMSHALWGEVPPFPRYLVSGRR